MRETLTALAILLTAPPALANWEYTRWGMTPDQVAAASSGNVKVLLRSERKDAGEHSALAATGTFKLGGKSFPVGFQFNAITNGLECVIYDVSGDDVAMVKDMLIRNYGKTEGTSFGPGYSMEWTTPEPVEFAVNSKPLTGVVNHCKAGAS